MRTVDALHQSHHTDIFLSGWSVSFTRVAEIRNKMSAFEMVKKAAEMNALHTHHELVECYTFESMCKEMITVVRS
ncbi:hypothetical protein PHET_01789 [Paragonimus heterotremus]|uniref:Uncharacterized protein n=1 Tax=Paragonimus heterotremus TaxID=100268 RepID=A0A8J4TGZ6_9TREM|nr:hypothetical protein PHET_01789 [Paragonimus heterotremus]